MKQGILFSFVFVVRRNINFKSKDWEVQIHCHYFDIQSNQQHMLDTIINIAGKTLNRAFKNANSKYIAENKVFSPQNWIKSKASIVSLTEALRVRLDAMEDDETNLGAKVQSCCKLEKQDFESRWTAD